jgi:diguanylate cyclase (GGDEF)-like protein
MTSRADKHPVRAMWREEDDLYRTATTRTAAVVLFSVAVLLLPRTAPIRWWAIGPAVVCLVGGLVCARFRGRGGRLRSWPSLVALSHHGLTQTGVGFAGVAVGGVEGNQRFLSMLVLVVTASYSPAFVVGVAWVMATATVFWSSVVSGLSGEVAFTVTAMFGASAAAIASIVHLLLTRIRRQNRQVRMTAALAASVARAQEFDEELPEILALTSAVLGGASLALSRVDPERIVVPLGVHAPTPARVPAGRRRRDTGFEEEVLVSVVDSIPFVLLVSWPSADVRRVASPQTVAIVRDLLGHYVERSVHIARLEERTRTDPLTGLGNRRALSEWLVDRNGAATVVIFDLDHFKAFNDAYGHVAGDQLLRRFGAVVRHHLRVGDCAVRLGGEEFCIALEARNEVLGQRFVDRVRTAFGADPGGVTFSAGVAVSEPGEVVDNVLRRADEALYEAKRQGRNRTVVAQTPE